MRLDLGKEHSEESQHSMQRETLDRRETMRGLREESKRLRVRPRSTQEDDVENSQSSAEPSGDGNRGQSGSGDMQVGRPSNTSICARSEATC